MTFSLAILGALAALGLFTIGIAAIIDNYRIKRAKHNRRTK